MAVGTKGNAIPKVMKLISRTVMVSSKAHPEAKPAMERSLRLMELNMNSN